MTLLVSVSGLGKCYGAAAVLTDVSFTLETGRHLAVLGPSGCGKSTLLRLIAGLETPTSGRIDIAGRTVSGLGGMAVPPHERGLGMVFQDLALWPDLTAIGNVELGLASAEPRRRHRRTRAREMLAWCGLASLESRRPAELSIGQQQRVAIARAFAPKPRLLLLDEPFSSLDWLLKGRLMEDLANWCSQLDTTLILVTHDPNEATALCADALALEDGRCAGFDTTRALLERAPSQLLRHFRDRP